jgi:hypothetical protein
MKLYELTQAHQQLDNLMDVEVDETQLLEAIDKVGGELQEKVTNIAKFIGNQEAISDAIKAAEERMAARRKAIENKIKSVKNYLLRNMEAAQISKIECEYFKISIRENPPSVIIDDEKAISPEYMRVPEAPPPSPDKRKILEDMKQGVIIDGVHLERTKSLVIR